ncbi:uncharacterized protein N7484_000807 [Penicillium longicatenatum]|uniref:uncharacterized protein n=1 Tax=Penicillium longicatenatum TaxID=1561947 RepID=UPI0025496994|nr:uncharacterized protein N7484_000807 [Penicillium longicatenatum]KAJ5657158.1 hypothetical protein N7484_000807 [Penicillium longicatenatum]
MPSSNSSPLRHRFISAPAVNVLLFLIGFRLVNALTIRTFFQPDEFFQSLEPAWQVAFGKDQGAWLTWEWQHQLRSSLHPLLFAAIYKITDYMSSILSLPSARRAELLIASPKTAQAVLSATSDFYTWKLARRIYGEDSHGAWATLIATIISPWQWFCSTRTLSNCLETTLTIVAMGLWPWQWSANSIVQNLHNKADDEKAEANNPQLLRSLRQCLSLAAVACILRPTNIIIWLALAGIAGLRGSWDQRKCLVREVLFCGSTILIASAIADRFFYGFWTFPPLRFLYFNIAQSLAVFYGRNNWHYYVTEGYPLLLTTLIPFAIPGLYLALTTRQSPASNRVQTNIRVQLAMICILMPFVLSFISHKEVRFIYPLLPSLHILAAPRLVQFFWPALTLSSHAYTPKRLTLLFLIFVNGVIAFYTSIYHASGPVNVLEYLRRQHETHLPSSNMVTPSSPVSAAPESGITVGFLMPCHSTPWRSHMVYPSINAWALSCEPPIGLNETQKAAYCDEADQFYNDPDGFLRQNMVGGLRHLPRRPSYVTGSRSLTSSPDSLTLHEWPDYLVFFAQLEPTMHQLIRFSSYRECWRTWNTAWHDDWRRRGDIVVWCLDPAEQDAWRSQTQRRVQENRDRQFDRIITAIKQNANTQPKREWKSLITGSLPWSPPHSPFSFASLQRTAQSLFTRLSPSPWPWGKRSRMDAFLANFRRQSTAYQALIPSWSSCSWSWPEWLGGPVNRKISKRERELWS